MGVRKKLLESHANGNHQSAIQMPVKNVEFISARLSALLHAVQGTSDCEGIANSHGANEAERRHEWDALLFKFFQPIVGKRDVLCVFRLPGHFHTELFHIDWNDN